MNPELEHVREYLQLLGRTRIQGRMQAKVDLSGIIQKTLLAAHHHCESWCELPEERRLAWFRETFSNNLRDEIRRFRTQARDVAREQSIHQLIEDSASRINDWLVSDLSTPISGVIRDEDAVRLAVSMSRLPADQRTAVEMHHLNDLPLADVARHLRRTREATAMLIYRGIKTLRKALNNEGPTE